MKILFFKKWQARHLVSDQEARERLSVTADEWTQIKHESHVVTVNVFPPLFARERSLNKVEFVLEASSQIMAESEKGHETANLLPLKRKLNDSAEHHSDIQDTQL